MTQRSYYLSKLKLILALSSTIITTSANNVLAQNITIDGTLSPAQTLNGPDYTIPQSVGQTVGSNLFHSFGQFSLIEGESASFQSNANIRNIFSRVTGGFSSNIDGRIRTQSNSINLFLINPSGIIFGPNARLNVGGSTRGSFVATTADALVWSNGSQFSATNPGGTSSLLTIVGDPSGFLFNSRPPQPIQAFGSSLGVSEGQSLLLLGGNVSLKDSTLFVRFTEGGRIEVGAVAEPVTVGLTTNGNILSLNFPENLTQADVSLNSAFLFATAENGGSIAINSRNIDILGGQLEAGIETRLGDINSQAGDITLNASEAIRIDRSRIINNVNRNATGNAGNIYFIADSLSLNDSQINASTFGQGNAGSVIINAQNVLLLGESTISNGNFGGLGNGGDIHITTALLSLNGGELDTSVSGEGNAGNVIINAHAVSLYDSRLDTSIGGSASGNAGSIILNAHTISFDRSVVISSSVDGTVGDSGNISITTNSLSLSNGAAIVGATFGQGNASSIQITAFDQVNISGYEANFNDEDGFFVPSGIFTSTNDILFRLGFLDGTSGRGGDITINTNLFRLSDSGVLDARTTGDSIGGNITVNARSVEILNGGQLITNTSGRGSAGKITVNATDRLIVNGSNTNFNDQVVQFGLFENVDAASGLFVRSDGLGSAGNIEVNSPFVLLDNGGRFIAESRSVNGGDISVNAGDTLLLRRGSQISTTAGTAQAGGNGGNININAGFVIALPNENSNITANAFSGTGGQVQINTQGIFGIEPRLNDSINSSDITASSTTGINGEIIINTPNVDPTQGLTNLPADTVNTANLVDSGCTAFDDKTGSQFNVTGRGGLPASPDDVLSGDAVWSDTRLTVAAKPQNGLVSRVTTPQKSSNTISIVPATAWVFNNQGEVTLVSQVAKADAYSVDSNHVACAKP